MGRVFTFAEIAQGRVPALESFPVVLDTVRKTLEHHSGVIGAIIYGSALTGAYTPRSDLDVFVLCGASGVYTVELTLGCLIRAAWDHYVPLNVTTLDETLARTSLSHVSPSFAAHLRFAVRSGGLIKTDPLPLLRTETSDGDDALRSYLRQKLRMFGERIPALGVMDEYERCAFFKKVLEAPVHVARKMLWWEGLLEDDDSSRVVRERYPQVASARERELFEELTAADAAYTAALARQQQRPNRGQYRELLGQIGSLASATREFVRLNAMRFDKGA